MKPILTLAAVSTACIVILWAATAGPAPLILDRPLAMIGLGLIGLGLIRHAQEHRAKPAAVSIHPGRSHRTPQD